MAERPDQTELEQILMRNFGPAQNLEPSSGFAATVIDRIQQEAERAELPPAIAFPWGRALPLLCVALLAAAVAGGLLIRALVDAASIAAASTVNAGGGARLPMVQIAVRVAHEVGLRAMQLSLGWVAVALLAALLPLLITQQMTASTPRQQSH